MYRQNREGSISYKLKMKNLEDLFLNIENVLSGSNKIRDADYLYLSHYYLEVIPYVMPFLKNPDVKRMLSKYKWLSKYFSYFVKWKFSCFYTIFKQIFNI